MPLQPNVNFLTPEAIITYLKADVLAFKKKNDREQKTKATQLAYLKKQLKHNFFNGSVTLSDAECIALLTTDERFQAYPYLKETLHAVFSLELLHNCSPYTLQVSPSLRGSGAAVAIQKIRPSN